MAVSTFFLVHIIERFSRLQPVTYRRIFNGYGVYHLGAQFAILLNDQVYFRADEESWFFYEEHAFTPFSSHVMDDLPCNFYLVPAESIVDIDSLEYWMLIALESTHRSCGVAASDGWLAATRQHLKLG